MEPGIRSLVIVREGDKVLLGYKKRGFGEGKWNGFGGKVEHEETVEESASRELKEESGLSVSSLSLRGVLDFSFEDGTEPLKVYVFLGEGIEGEPVETEEMRPAWFSIDRLPFEKMWADDVYWVPLLFEGGCFTGIFHFKDGGQLVSSALKRVARIE
jgi:8-oxo-dGTP diphosphatase / 2-hydroxy-dATP diphosphatase